MSTPITKNQTEWAAHEIAMHCTREHFKAKPVEGDYVTKSDKFAEKYLFFLARYNDFFETGEIPEPA